MNQLAEKGGEFIFEKNFVFLVELILIMGYSLYHLFIFFDTFMVYAALHAIREGWSYSKSDISSTFGVSKEYLGIVDALYLVSYSAGMAVLGSCMHRFTLKIYVIMGLTVASICYMSWMVIYSVTGFYNVVFMTILMCINGFFQATGWPGIMGIFSQWFAGHRKGVLMGIWSCSANAGDIIASVFLNMFSDHNVDFVWNFILTGGLAFLVALSILLFLK
jgi:sugar phosphate permease